MSIREQIKEVFAELVHLRAEWRQLVDHLLEPRYMPEPFEFWLKDELDRQINEKGELLSKLLEEHPVDPDELVAEFEAST